MSKVAAFTLKAQLGVGVFQVMYGEWKNMLEEKRNHKDVVGIAPL